MISLRGRDGPVDRRGLPLRRHDVDLGDRRRAGHGNERHSSAGTSPPSWYAVLLPSRFVIYLIAVVGETNRAPVRPARGRVRAGRRLPHRVLLAEVRAVLPRRVHQHGHRLGAGHDAVPRRLAGPVADLALGRRQPRLVADALVPRQGRRCCSSSSSGCAARCPGCATTSSCGFGWKVLVPISLVWILVVATMRTLRDQGLSTGQVTLLVGVPIALIVLVGLLIASRSPAATPALAAEAGGACTRRRTDVLPPSDRGRPPAPAGPRAASRSRRWTCRCRRRRGCAPAGRRAAPVVSTGRRGTDRRGERRRPTPRSSDESTAAQPPGRPDSVCRLRQGLRRHLRAHVQEGRRPSSTRSSTTPTAPRYHGRHVLNRHPDGLEKCVGCELCAWACPADAIYVEGGDNTEDARFSPGERYGAVYQINYLRCIFCGLCIEACPTRSLTMSNEYELADDNRQDLIFTKEQLLAPLLPGMEAPPHPMRLGDDEKDYYLGALRRARRRRGRRRRPADHRHGDRGRGASGMSAAAPPRPPRSRCHRRGRRLLDPRPARAGRRARHGARPQRGALGAVPGATMLCLASST